MTTLLVDNYDSYTYNVFHLLPASAARNRSSCTTTWSLGGRSRAGTSTRSCSPPVPDTRPLARLRRMR